MDRIRLENLRSLKNTGWIDIKPITVLLGKNSSGKSSFLRLFPLLRQSLETPTTGPILWNGRLVDFGSFAEAVNRNKGGHEEIVLGFEGAMQVDWSLGRFRPSRIRKAAGPKLICELSLSGNVPIGTTRLKRMRLIFMGHCLEIVFPTANRKKGLIEVNGENLSHFFSDQDASSSSFYQPLRDMFGLTTLSHSLSHTRIQQSIKDFLRPFLHPRTSKEKLVQLLSSFRVGSDKEMLHSIQTSHAGTTTWKKNTADWTLETDDFSRLKNLVISLHIRKFLDLVIDLSGEFLHVRYLAPIRATAERYYRIQDLAVNEIDFRGDNLAMFLRSLNAKQQKAFSAWTREYFGFTVIIQAEGGHVSLGLSDGDKEFNLADMGFGFSQLLPIITQLWILASGNKRERRTIHFAIEQPELHLHPGLQAKLADSFLAAIVTAREHNVDLRLIIETHSEAMVNRFGHRIAEKETKADDINVVLFEKDSPTASTRVRISGYDENGFLTNWPFGFFEPDMV